MLNQVFIKDKFLIKTAYKRVGKFGEVESFYFILADGSVINVLGSIMKTADYRSVPNIDHIVYKFGGNCISGDGGIMLGKEIDKRVAWEFSCTDCGYKVVVYDNKVDELVYNALNGLEMAMAIE